MGLGLIGRAPDIGRVSIMPLSRDGRLTSRGRFILVSIYFEAKTDQKQFRELQLGKSRARMRRHSMMKMNRVRV